MELLFRNGHKIYDRVPLTFLLFPRRTAQRASLQTMFLLELEVFFPQGVHAVNHLLDKLHLRVAKTVLV